MENLRITEDDLSGPAIAALLRLHLEEMHRFSPPGSVHAMPIERLRHPDVTFYSAWDGDVLAGCGALKRLDAHHGELKSMRAAPAYRGKGVGRAILHHLMDEARRRGYTRLSLETGRPGPFLPARRLYESHGFTECPPFGSYTADPFSICMTRTLCVTASGDQRPLKRARQASAARFSSERSAGRCRSCSLRITT